MTSEINMPLVDAQNEGLVFACRLDGKGSAKLLNWSDIEVKNIVNHKTSHPIWIHLDITQSRACNWVLNFSGLSRIVAQALLVTQCRPRVFYKEQSLTTILRGMNTNKGASPEDMVALRIWSNGNYVISIQQQRLESPRHILSYLLVSKTGPETTAELYMHLINQVTKLIGLTVEALEDDLEQMDMQLETSDPADLRGDVKDMRRKLIALRRYIAPQREALNALLLQPPEWFDETALLHLHEAADRTIYYVEEIDSAVEQTQALKNEIASRLAEATNRILYVLAIISGIFLPFGFLTGLFGINLGGMPGVNRPEAFLLFCISLPILFSIEIWIFKRLKWL